MLRNLLVCWMVVVALDLTAADSWQEQVAAYKKKHAWKKTVFRLEGPNGPQTIKTFEEGEALCKQHKAKVAEAFRLKESISNKNAEMCTGCGWLKRTRWGNRWNYKNHRPVCGKKEEETKSWIVACPPKPSDIGQAGYDVYCFGKAPPAIPPDAVAINILEDRGYVFLVKNHEGEIASQSLASSMCAKRDARIAKSEQVFMAYHNGMSTCACGWMINYSGYPMRDSIASCGGRPEFVGCDSGILKHAYCFVDARAEPTGGNLVDFSKLAENTYPMGIEDGAVQIAGGYVYTTIDPRGEDDAGRIFDAFNVCTNQGATVATTEQLNVAQEAGKEDCFCGWTWEDVYLMAGTRTIGNGGVYKSCKSGVENCKTKNGNGYRIHCFKHCPHHCPPAENWNIPHRSVKVDGGRVYHVEGQSKYSLTAEGAKSECEKTKGVLATMDQLTEARMNGMSKCRCGYLKDGSVAFPMYRPIEGCGGDVGVFTCPGEYSDIPETGPNWDAYCFISDETLSGPSVYDAKLAEQTAADEVEVQTVEGDFVRGGKPEEGYTKQKGVSLMKQFKRAQRAKARKAKRAKRAKKAKRSA